MVLVNVGGEDYFMEDFLKKKWDTLKDGKLQKLDEDRVYIVVGRERSGKSLWTLQQAAYIDPTIINEGDARKRITFSPEKSLKSIKETQSNPKETKVLIFDEAFRGLSSRAAISKTNKKVIQALMEMGQKNLILFIVLPSFKMLDRYAAVERSNALIQIKKSKKGKQRIFKIYNEHKKEIMYENRNALKKVTLPTKMKGRFFGKYPGGDRFEKLYRRLKKESLEENEGIKEEEKKNIHKEKYDNIVITLYDELGSYRKVYEKLKAYNAGSSLSTLHEIVGKRRK